MSITSKLFKAARYSADVRALSSMNAGKVGRRIKNKVVGRVLARTLFRFLYK